MCDLAAWHPDGAFAATRKEPVGISHIRLYGQSGGRPDQGSCGCGACFIAGTKVQCEGEEKNIEDIVPGDYVNACDTDTGEKALKKVRQMNLKHLNYAPNGCIILLG